MFIFLSPLDKLWPQSLSSSINVQVFWSLFVNYHFPNSFALRAYGYSSLYLIDIIVKYFLFMLELQRVTDISFLFIWIHFFLYVYDKFWRQSFLSCITRLLKPHVCSCFYSFAFIAHECHNFYFLFLQRDLISCLLYIYLVQKCRKSTYGVYQFLGVFLSVSCSNFSI